MHLEHGICSLPFGHQGIPAQGTEFDDDAHDVVVKTPADSFRDYGRRLALSDPIRDQTAKSQPTTTLDNHVQQHGTQHGTQHSRSRKQFAWSEHNAGLGNAGASAEADPK